MTDRWSDLAVRVASGLAMAVVGLWAIWQGGLIFHEVVALICAAMVWELARMISPDQRGPALILAAIAGVASTVAGYTHPTVSLPVLLVPSLVGLAVIRGQKGLFAFFAALILFAGYGMTTMRDDQGFAWLAWLACVVVATDVLGYFAGRMIGGPKFWPAISPKKTWSGTVGGWIGAALVGWGFFQFAGLPGALIWLSVLASFASQMGDIAESAIKRRMGVKDSSNLIPGHGGVMDRFDGMLGASLFVLIAGNITGSLVAGAA